LKASAAEIVEKSKYLHSSRQKEVAEKLAEVRPLMIFTQAQSALISTFPLAEFFSGFETS
jgi:hypothetical protein